MDAELKLDEGSDSDNDSDNDSEDAKNHPLIQEVGAEYRVNGKINEKNGDVSNQANETNVGPTIQLEFTIGDISSNPLMKLLANDDEENSEKSNEGDSKEDDEPLTARRREAVVNLLQPVTESKKSDHGIDIRMSDDNPLLFNVIKNGSVSGASDKNAGKKRLITEIS